MLCAVAFYTRYLTAVIIAGNCSVFFQYERKTTGRNSVPCFIYGSFLIDGHLGCCVTMLFVESIWLDYAYGVTGSAIFPELSLLRDYQPTLSFGLIVEALKENGS